MNSQGWRDAAKGMLEVEARMRPFHWPPSTGCLVTWRDRVLVGMIQHPVDDCVPAVVFLSVTSKYIDPEYIRTVREIDHGRLELIGDPQLDLGCGNFHIVRREGERLTFMTREETRYVEMSQVGKLLVQVQPTEDGIDFIGIGKPIVVPKRKP